MNLSLPCWTLCSSSSPTSSGKTSHPLCLQWEPTKCGGSWVGTTGHFWCKGSSVTRAPVTHRGSLWPLPNTHFACGIWPHHVAVGPGAAECLSVSNGGNTHLPCLSICYLRTLHHGGFKFSLPSTWTSGQQCNPPPPTRCVQHIPVPLKQEGERNGRQVLPQIVPCSSPPVGNSGINLSRLYYHFSSTFPAIIK